ncbi:uncharacterized protein LOC131037510 isoform X2 [Cryptomeria japonica]|uniref:uncharacterized protein LOC131037510 isoform X2 n=1 Tax=Cryptomeria japonica TaxID=3369 RepID=UPI0025ABDC66|nr:uncharacterized protein LOC131037510 isoform X2 [Cryptomeria japonica]
MGTNIETVVKKYEIEIWECLEMLRSASDYNAEESKSRGWKLKQDNDEFRVMYREGPQGTPFHTLLVEGYINGPLDSCLCVGLESSLYPHWWPQFTVPTFKILESRCLKKIHIGEELSLVRMKIPWPLLPREMIFRYFELEYFEEDSVFVLLKSVSDSQLDNNINGFSSEDIPPANGTVRMDLMGGFALQKVDSAQSYFRTIVNLDIKLDFVPPSLINFISRQLIGHGYKLYQKIQCNILSSADLIASLYLVQTKVWENVKICIQGLGVFPKSQFISCDFQLVTRKRKICIVSIRN